MKALVVEIRRRKAAVLLDDGRVILVPDKNYAAGQELELHSARNMRKRTVAWAASAAAAILIFVGALLYMAPYYYVSLDVNPSIEFSVNRLDQVLEVNAVNSDAQGIVSEMNGTDHIPVEQAVNLAMKVLSSKHYFDGEGTPYVLLSVASPDTQQTEQLAALLTQSVQTSPNSPSNLSVECVTGSRQQADDAKKMGVTLGKKTVVDELQSNPDAAQKYTYEEWLQQPVRKIMQEMKPDQNAKDPASTASTASSAKPSGTEKDKGKPQETPQASAAPSPALENSVQPSGQPSQEPQPSADGREGRLDGNAPQKTKQPDTQGTEQPDKTDKIQDLQPSHPVAQNQQGSNTPTPKP